MVCQCGHGSRQEIATCAGGDIVEDDRLGAGIGNGCKEFDEAVLGGLVVVGCDQQHGIGACLASEFGQLDGIGCVIGAGACNDRYTSCHLLDTEADGRLMLLIGQGRAFARCAANHDGINAFTDLPFDQLGKMLVIDFVIGDGGYDGGGGSGKYGVFHGLPSFYFKRILTYEKGRSTQVRCTLPLITSFRPQKGKAG